LLRFGVDLYNARHFWHAHEAWEQVWLDAEDELRPFYQGLIQVTAAFVHVVRDEYPGSVRLLEAGIEKLAAYPASFMAIELGALVEGARQAHARLVELGERRIGQFERELIPRIALSDT
jgi:predicted metal-dependent hydrolase